MRLLLYRPILISGAILTLALLLVLTAFVALTWRNLERIHQVEQTVGQVNRLQAIEHRLQQLSSDTIHSAERDRLQAELSKLARGRLQLPVSPMQRLLERPTQERLEAAIQGLQNLLEQENTNERNLLAKVVYDTHLELEAALMGTAALIVLLGLGILLAKHWVFTPLKKMSKLLLRLEEGRFEPIPIPEKVPPWSTLISNYNRMVTRLAALEQARQAHTRSLEAQVSAAARTLLAQSQDLARAERLAAVGEVAAGIAHELRNPLAGIQLALHNLRAECADPENQQRFNLIITELDRLGRHLNQLLDQARHQPEPIKEIHIDSVIREILALLRYQVPDAIRLHYSGMPEVKARLPETGLRQALINLVLNAAQVLNEKPGNIWIETHQNQDRLVLTVSDDGPGFPEELLKNGIRSFASGRAGGTGLGLLMVKRFVSSLDGRMQLAPSEPQGARVIVEIPCAIHS
ncbi:sensor histidine kinase [Methylohalobius crimeensis]|uniref:sensor histidine kinase n=1 Tax=Methylohalobius crimeensis TaxID=244365 RepID=UPI0003B780B7|nr:ATP-binding protein [Methylohalobius crimeensis]